MYIAAVYINDTYKIYLPGDNSGYKLCHQIFKWTTINVIIATQ